MNRHFKTIYLFILRDGHWALTEKLTWAFPVGFKVSIYQAHEWFMGNAFGHNGVPMPMPNEPAARTYLLNEAGITECQGDR